MTELSNEQLMQLETQFWDAIRDRDGQTVAELTARDCTIVGASGVTAVDPGSIRQMIEHAPYEITDYRIDPSSTRIVPFADDSVAISYGVHEDVVVDGRKVKLDAFDSSVWQLRDNDWTCVLHTESIAGDAFGRDCAAA